MKRFGTVLLSVAFAAVLGVISVGTAQAAEGHTDAGISASVHVVLLEKLGADALHVSVHTHEGHVQLAGTVTKRETKELAEDIAKKVSGVVSVDNDLRTVKEITGSDRVSVAAKEVEHETKDAILTGRVRAHLIGKMGSDALKVHIHTADGVVYLTFSKELGKAERKKSAELARGTEGVKKVISH